MENIIKPRKYRVSEQGDWTNYQESIDENLVSTMSDEEAVEIELPLKSFNHSLVEDSGDFLRNFYKGKDVVLNESWDITETIQGKIVHFNEDEIFVDCLVDLEKRVFEHRVFQKDLFKNISNITADKPVLIKTRMKAGSFRIDVYPGEGIVDLNLFELNEDWEELRGSGLDDKLVKW